MRSPEALPQDASTIARTEKSGCLGIATKDGTRGNVEDDTDEAIETKVGGASAGTIGA